MSKYKLSHLTHQKQPFGNPINIHFHRLDSFPPAVPSGVQFLADFAQQLKILGCSFEPLVFLWMPSVHSGKGSPHCLRNQKEGQYSEISDMKIVNRSSSLRLPVKNIQLVSRKNKNGGENGIRTRGGTISSSPVQQTSAFDHSAISPNLEFYIYILGNGQTKRYPN